METSLTFFKRNRRLHRRLLRRPSVHRDMTEMRLMEGHLAHLSIFEDTLREGIAGAVFNNVDVRIAPFAVAGIIHALSEPARSSSPAAP